MKRVLCMLFVLAVSFACTIQTGKAEPRIYLTNKADMRYINVPGISEGNTEDIRVIETDHDGRTDLWIDGTAVNHLDADNEIYRLRITEYRADGSRKIVVNKSFVNHHDYYDSMVWRDVLLASESGMYGPYLVEIAGNHTVIREFVCFDVDASQYEGEPDKGILLEGGQAVPDFVETKAPFTICEPNEQTVAMWGVDGDFLQCILELDRDYDSLTLSLSDVETGEVISTYKTEQVSQFAMLDIPVEGAFRSGAEYELRVAGENDVQTRRFRLVDASLAESAEPLSVEILREDGTCIDIESFRQNDCYVIDPSDPDEGTVSFRVQGGSGLYRLKLIRAGGNEEIVVSANWHTDNVLYGQLLLNQLTDELFCMQITSGIQKIEYDVKFVMNNPSASPWMQQAPWDGKEKFVVSAANNVPLSIVEPAEGSTMHGCPGYRFPVKVEVMNAGEMVVVSLEDCETGTTVVSKEYSFEKTGTYKIYLEFPSDYEFADGAEFAVEVTQNGRSCIHAFQMHRENPF